ncbi:hypothetical protein Arnit_0189 [Arcobacter nitrofigilis DSM 7299]|uniref:Pycsar effector protein domain-containing protein n=1 Tax=Arcobacter nitrofigilis (strain ATCC 33309 / DSM 7299 / CCUG 15893 / LMG 7604 / NCTC 12251 / CI) TaxID=572480 RepID=D5V4C3_ARCNC|nr:Pycsar system effector family protein [Arcobacter nitrofigilis]ADG91856.1 hypothetical protein Arnit_0189 [Arcobacter nitrofigilis DSM 7299]
MEKEDRIELLKCNIGRFDFYYGSVNFKSSFLIIANITILGFLLSNVEKLCFPVFVLNAVFIFFSILFVLFAINPYLKSVDAGNSILFFGDIASKKINVYKTNFNNVNEDKYIEDLVEQNYYLSTGLKNKFKYLNIATISFIISIICYFIQVIYVSF